MRGTFFGPSVLSLQLSAMDTTPAMVTSESHTSTCLGKHQVEGNKAELKADVLTCQLPKNHREWLEGGFLGLAVGDSHAGEGLQNDVMEDRGLAIDEQGNLEHRP